ncbi:MAG: hypothetical protein GXP28_07765 [Planctomycetes bacterium]|nr:hypothetical protein [Planctomycetota bacterium]
MTLRLTGMAALIACLGAAGAHSVRAQRQVEYQTAGSHQAVNPYRTDGQYEYQTAGQYLAEEPYQEEYEPDPRASESFASYNSFDAGGFDNGELGGCSGGACGGCSDGGCAGGGRGLNLGGSLASRPGQFFAGAEYIYARASFSEALAYVVTDVNANPVDGGPQFVEYDFDYNSSYRFYGGYRFCDCGGEIVFNFSRFRSDSSFNAVEGAGLEIFGPYEIDPPGTGANGTLSGNANVEINSYDISFAKTIPLGSPLGRNDCCDPCCDTDCGSWCPAWDVTWSAGLRFAEVDWARSSVAATAAGDQIDAATTRLDFKGTGARVGLLGRRYIGRGGMLSVYAKGDISLLVGDMNISTLTVQDPDGTGAFAAQSHRNSGRRVIPVTEIEAGLTAQLGNHVRVSSGYFISAWHDLGMRDEYVFEDPGTGAAQFQLGNYDDANILGFDGFFARAEISY